MNLCSFKLNLVYLDPLNMSKAGDFSWICILKDFIQVQKEEGKFVANWEVLHRSHAMGIKEMY